MKRSRKQYLRRRQNPSAQDFSNEFSKFSLTFAEHFPSYSSQERIAPLTVRALAKAWKSFVRLTEAAVLDRAYNYACGAFGAQHIAKSTKLTIKVHRKLIYLTDKRWNMKPRLWYLSKKKAYKNLDFENNCSSNNTIIKTSALRSLILGFNLEVNRINFNFKNQ